MTDVKGYTPLTDAQKALANEGKELEERVMRWLDKLIVRGTVEGWNIDESDDSPLALTMIGKRNIQQGFMWAIRSIFRPARIALPEDETHPPKPLAETVKDAER